jgi:hypothetical protein
MGAFRIFYIQNSSYCLAPGKWPRRRLDRAIVVDRGAFERS